MPRGDIDETVLKRLVRAGQAPGLPALAVRLREIVLLLRREDIALDYALLAGQLCQWQQLGGRDVVRRAWGRSFHAYRPPQEAVPGPDGPFGSVLDTDLAAVSVTTKDAS